MVYIGEVVDINDPNGGDRIKVRLLPEDKRKDIEEIPFAFPLLPKQLHVKPKVGEAVMVICAVDTLQTSQRYYIGPIISQPQDMYYDDYELGATSLLKRGLAKPKKTIEYNTSATGSLAKDDEIAIYSRQNSDVILSNNDVRIRCGSRLLDPIIGNQTGDNITFNKSNPSFIKLKYHESGIENKLQPNTVSHSTATIVADEVNILTHKNLNDEFKMCDPNEQIDDAEMAKIVDKAHVLPYGDVLVDFLMGFLQMFKSHTHNYNNDTPVEDDYAKTFDAQFGRGTRDNKNTDYMTKTNGVRVEMVNNTFNGLYDKLLSKNVRIN